MMFILLSELVFSLGFSQSVFTSVFFPRWMLGHHPPKFVFVCGPSSLLCSVCVVSTNDFLVWRAQQAPYHLLSVLMTFWSGVHSKRLITYWSLCMFGMLVCCYML